MLAAFVPPPGAKRLSSVPDGSGGILKHKAFTVGVADQLDDVSFWRVPASAESVLAFEKAHLPRQFTLTRWGSVGDTSGRRQAEASAPHPAAAPHRQYLRCLGRPVGLAGVPGVIDLRELTVEVTDPSSSVTYVRVDANVAWIPPRPASEKVPAGVKVVTITASPNMNHPKGTPAPVTVTSPAKVAKIVALLDGLSLKTSETISCPDEAGRGHHAVLPGQAGRPGAGHRERVDPELRQRRLHHRTASSSQCSRTGGRSRPKCSPSPARTGPAGTSDAAPPPHRVRSPGGDFRMRNEPA